MADDDDKLRLGGMALRNGLLVHGPTHWAAAVRAHRRHDRHGVRAQAALHAARRRARPARRRAPGRGDGRHPARQARAARGAAAVPAGVRRRTAAAARRVGAAVLRRRATRLARRRGGRRGAARSCPALVALRGGELAAYHGAEHKAIGAYEQGTEDHTKEHDRCGSHLMAPLIASNLAGAALLKSVDGEADAAGQRRGRARLVGVAVEVFALERAPRRHRGRARAAPPRPRAAARASARASRRRRSSRSAAPRSTRSCAPRPPTVTPRRAAARRRLPAARRADPRGLLLRQVLQPDEGAARARRPPPARASCRPSRSATRSSAGSTRRSRSCASAPGAAARTATWVAGWPELEVRALHEGDAIEPWEPVLTIEGDYALFAHLETVYLGCLARRTLIMRNVARSSRRPTASRSGTSRRATTTGSCRPATAGRRTSPGAIGVSTDAQASWWGGRGMGTVPHGLIAAYGGDTARAARAFADRYADEMNVTVLVDFENDSRAHRARGRRRARRRAVGRAPGHERHARRPLALASEMGPLQADRRQRAARRERPRRRSTRAGPSGT